MKLLVLLSVLATMMFTNEYSSSDDPKHFVVSRAGSLKMSPQTQAKLENAFKTVYGKKIGYEMLKLEKIDDKSG